MKTADKGCNGSIRIEDHPCSWSAVSRKVLKSSARADQFSFGWGMLNLATPTEEAQYVRTISARVGSVNSFPASAQACSISVPAVVPAIAVPAFLCTSAPMIPGDRGLSGADSLKLKDGSR